MSVFIVLVVLGVACFAAHGLFSAWQEHTLVDASDPDASEWARDRYEHNEWPFEEQR